MSLALGFKLNQFKSNSSVKFAFLSPANIKFKLIMFFTQAQNANRTAKSTQISENSPQLTFATSLM